MGNTRNTGYLQNAIKVSDAGAISFMSGSTMLATINTSGQMSGSAPVLFAATASFVANAQSASNAVSAQTASFANAFTVASTLTAQTLVVQTITSSVDFVTGSTRFGSILGNTHIFSGSVIMNPGGLFVSSSGFVGIGNTTPIIDLQIGNRTILQNVVNAQSSYANNVYYNGVNWFLKDAGTGTAVRLNSPDSVGDISFHTIASGSAGANVGTQMDTTGVKMIIKNNGNIGIGTTTVVEGTQAASSISIFPTSSVSNGPLIQFPGNGRIRPASTGDRLSIDGNSLFLNSTFGGNVIIATGGGSVGIGTSSPTEILHLNSASTNAAFIRFQNTGGSGVYIGGRGNNMELYAGGSERMRIISEGNVLIGTATDNGSRLRIVTATTDARISISHSGNGGALGYTNLGSGASSNVFYIATGAGTVGSGITMNNDGNIAIVTTASNILDNHRFGIARDGAYSGDVHSSQLALCGVTDTRMRISMGYDTTNNYGYIVAGQLGVTWTSLWLQRTAGAVYAGSARIDNNSDIRVKDNIQPITGALDKVLSMNGKKFHMVDEPEDKIRMGFIAQELQGVVDELVIESGRTQKLPSGEIIENVLGLETWGSSWAALLVEAMKELKAENDTLKEILQRNNIQ